MNAAVGSVFIDTCTLANFAIVDRLDLLATRYGWRAVWTETIQDEVRRGVPSEPTLQKVLEVGWLGQPIEVELSTKGLREVDRIRRGLSDGLPPQDSTKHLGEAEVIYLLEHGYIGGVLITDDRPARDFARNRRLTALDSAEVLAECYQMNEVGCPEAFDLLGQMADAGRGVRVPPSHIEVCPS